MRAMKNIRKRLNSRSGFTLAELLMTVLILLLVSVIVAGGVPAAINVYHKAVDAANAQSLLSTGMTRLRDEFCTATEIEPDGANAAITYKDCDGLASTLTLVVPVTGDGDTPVQNDAACGIYKTYTDSTVTPEGLGGARLLISQETSGNRAMYLRYTLDDDAYADGVLTFKSLQVFKGQSEDPIAEVTNFRIRVLTYIT